MSPSSSIGWLYRFAAKFGLATVAAYLLAGWLLYGDHRRREEETRERRELLTALKGAIEQQTKALATLAAEQRATGDALRVTWPRLRLPRPPQLAASEEGP